MKYYLINAICSFTIGACLKPGWMAVVGLIAMAGLIANAINLKD